MALAIKYRVSASFDLATEIEPEGLDHKIDREVEDLDGVEDFNGNSYFSAQSVTCDGGDLAFTIEAEDEDDAEQKLRSVLDDGSEFEDQNGFTWVVESIQIEVEALEEEPPTVEEAIVVLKDFVDNNLDAPADEFHQRIAMAAKVVLDDHTRLAERVGSLEHQMSSLHTRVRELNDEMAKLRDFLQKSGVSLPVDLQ